MTPIGRPTVLVVEDDPELRRLYQTTLALSGYMITTASDGIEALRQIEAGPPDIIVLDLALPRLGGADVQREIASHAETALIPVVIVTADASGYEPDDAACVLHKPVELDALVAAVDSCLRQFR